MLLTVVDFQKQSYPGIRHGGDGDRVTREARERVTFCGNKSCSGRRFVYIGLCRFHDLLKGDL